MEDENVPDFCTTCSLIGHPATRCKLNQPKKGNGVHVHSGKVVGKKTVFIDDFENNDLDKGNKIRRALMALMKIRTMELMGMHRLLVRPRAMIVCLVVRL